MDPRCGSNPVRYVMTASIDNDTIEVGGPRYFERIGRFLDEVAPKR